MHDMDSLGHMLQIDLPQDWASEPSTVPGCVEGGGQPVQTSEQCFILFLLFLFLLGLILGPFEFCVFVAGWRL